MFLLLSMVIVYSPLGKSRYLLSLIPDLKPAQELWAAVQLCLGQVDIMLMRLPPIFTTDTFIFFDSIRTPVGQAALVGSIV